MADWKKLLRSAFIELSGVGVIPLKLLSCNGAKGRGVCFNDSHAEVDYVYEMNSPELQIYLFSELFPSGYQMLADFIESGEKPEGDKLCILERLLAFILQIEETNKALQGNTERSSKMEVTELSARLAVHLFAPLSHSKDHILDCHSRQKCKKCPCLCGETINYGNTLIGSPKTWYGTFDILVGKDVSKNRSDAAPDDVGATVLFCEESTNPDAVSDDESSLEDFAEIEVKSDDSLESHLSQLLSQTVVFSFHQRKHFPFLHLVPYIGVNEEHIQFHFYDSLKDLYFVSNELELFLVNNNLHLTTVLVIWLVLNHRFFMSEATEEMLKDGKFGFHSFAQGNLEYYRNELAMGMKTFKPCTFELGSMKKLYHNIHGKNSEEFLEEAKRRKLTLSD